MLELTWHYETKIPSQEKKVLSIARPKNSSTLDYTKSKCITIKFYFKPHLYFYLHFVSNLIEEHQ